MVGECDGMSEFHTQKWKTMGGLCVVIDPELPPETTADKVPIRHIAQTFGRGIDENEANARLIAEAPAMYRFCLKHKDDPEVREILARIDGKKEEKQCP